MSNNATDLTGVLGRWVHAMCVAGSAHPAELSTSMDIDISQATRLGGQLVVPPPTGTEHFEFVIGLDSEDVVFAEFTPSADLYVEDLAESFGTGRPTPPSPHASGQTIILDEVWPTDAPRACAVILRLRGWSDSDPVEAVTLYVRPRPDRDPFDTTAA